MPAIGRFIKRMTGLRASPLLNPEEAVALGAAVQAGVIDGSVAQKVRYMRYMRYRPSRRRCVQRQGQPHPRWWRPRPPVDGRVVTTRRARRCSTLTSMSVPSPSSPTTRRPTWPSRRTRN